jgi:hypothetical protein
MQYTSRAQLCPEQQQDKLNQHSIPEQQYAIAKLNNSRIYCPGTAQQIQISI